MFVLKVFKTLLNTSLAENTNTVYESNKFIILLLGMVCYQTVRDRLLEELSIVALIFFR